GGTHAASWLAVPFCPRFRPLECVRNGIVDGLIVAEFEMKERVVLDRAPVPSKQRVRTNKVDRPRAPSRGAFGHHQEDSVSHPLADQGEEAAGEVGPAPLA